MKRWTFHALNSAIDDGIEVEFRTGAAISLISDLYAWAKNSGVMLFQGEADHDFSRR